MVPEYCGLTPLMLSQQSSLRGIRTALTVQASMYAIDVSSSVGPSQIPQPSAQAYSAPDRLTPRNCTTLPLESTMGLPDTLIVGTAADAATCGAAITATPSSKASQPGCPVRLAAMST